MEVFSKSDVGLVRTQNQDDFRFGVISPSCVWAVVCDGMGGANGGNIASATAVEYISTKITDLYKEDMTKEQIGELTYEEAQHHPNKNFITRALGIKPSVRLDYIEANFIYGDVLLICSDGLSNHVTTGDMVKICHENRGDDLINKLIDCAKNGGGTDNITATVIY